MPVKKGYKLWCPKCKDEDSSFYADAVISFSVSCTNIGEPDQDDAMEALGNLEPTLDKDDLESYTCQECGTDAIEIPIDKATRFAKGIYKEKKK